MRLRFKYMLVWVLSSVLTASVASAGTLDTDISYQAQLRQNGAPVNNTCDFEFSLWDANGQPNSGNQIGSTIAKTIAVKDGLFQVDLDFSAGATDENARWLEVRVCCSSPCSPSLITLSPRHSITGAPYSVRTRGICVGSTGEVGVGTANPTQKLDVRGQLQVQDSIRLDAADEPMVVRQWNPMTSGPLAGFGRWGMFMQFTNLFLGVPGTDFLGGSSIGFGGWKEDGTQERWMTIQKGGKVGIGTSAPAADLHIVHSNGTEAFGGVRIENAQPIVGAGTVYLDLKNNAPSVDNTYRIQHVGPVLGREGNFEIWDVGANAARLAIDAEGDVGIGTTSPIAPLEVRNGVDPSVLPAVNGLEPTIFATSSNPGTSAFTPVAVLGHTDDQYGVAIFGEATHSDGIGVASIGDMIVIGAKSFAQPHPVDASKEIRFVALEGNESGTYFRGTAKLNSGRVVIDVPAEFRNASEARGLTVQVTALGPHADLWVESKDLEHIVVRGNGNAEFDYFVNGVRRGFAGFKVVRENHLFVPSVAGKPFMTQLPEAARRIMVQNGTLNEDFTPNEATARRMGWKLRQQDQAVSKKR